MYTCDGNGGGRKVIKIWCFGGENRRINMAFGSCRGKAIGMGWWSWCMR